MWCTLNMDFGWAMLKTRASCDHFFNLFLNIPFFQVIGNIKDDECFSPLDIPITIGTLPIRDDTNVSIVNSDSRSVISNQPTITQLNVERSISRSTESTQLSLSMSPLSSHSLTLLSPKTPGPASASSISTPITPFDIDSKIILLLFHSFHKWC